MAFSKFSLFWLIIAFAIARYVSRRIRTLDTSKDGRSHLVNNASEEVLDAQLKQAQQHHEQAEENAKTSAQESTAVAFQQSTAGIPHPITMNRSDVVSPGKSLITWVCCCKKGRCESDEAGVLGWRALEIKSDETCCKRHAEKCPTPSSILRPTTWAKMDWFASSWSKHAVERCGSEYEQNVVEMFKDLRAACRSAAQAFIDGILRFTRGISYHGDEHELRHSRQLQEKIVSALFFGDPYPRIADPLFKIHEAVKLLWSGVKDEIRDLWKTALNAGEMSEGGSTAFSGIVGSRDVGFFKHCPRNATRPHHFSSDIFWEAASERFSLVDPEKPMTIIIGHSLEKLESRAFWRTELTALAKLPPMGRIDIIAVDNARCSTLMPAIVRRIHDLTWTERRSRMNWAQRSDAPLTCKDAALRPPFDAAAPGHAYPSPMQQQGELTCSWTSQQLIAAGYTREEVALAIHPEAKSRLAEILEGQEWNFQEMRGNILCVEMIAEALRHKTSISTLDLSGHRLTSIKPLAEALAHSSLTKLDLSDTNLRKDGALQLIKATENKKSWTGLKLDRCDISNDDAFDLLVELPTYSHDRRLFDGKNNLLSQGLISQGMEALCIKVDCQYAIKGERVNGTWARVKSADGWHFSGVHTFLMFDRDWKMVKLACDSLGRFWTRTSRILYCYVEKNAAQEAKAREAKRRKERARMRQPGFGTGRF